MSFISKPPAFYISFAIGTFTFFSSLGVPMIFPSTPLNGIIIIVIGITICIPFFVWAYALSRGKREIKDIFPKKRMSKMIAFLGFVFIIIGFIILISQLDFNTTIKTPTPEGAPPVPEQHPPAVAQKQYTPEEIAKAIKKEIAPQIKGNEITKYPPDLTKAKKETRLTDINQFTPENVNKLKVGIPGYFELSVDPNPQNPYYSYHRLFTKEKFSGHYYTTVQMGALENVQTMDLLGDICVCISPEWNAFFIWESEQSQKGWLPIKVKQEMHPFINTVSVHQNGRDVSVFVNNEFVGAFIRQKPSSSQPIGIGLKANRKTGGKMLFQSFAIWEF